MASADFCRTRPQSPTVAPPFGQALLTGTCDRSPWIMHTTFAAQALDLPMQTNEDGFVMMGSLACPHRPCIEFLYVTSQLWRECGRRRVRCRLDDAFAGFLSTVCYLAADQRCASVPAFA